MQIIHDFLTKNDFSRPARPLKEVKGIVIHWTANPNANAKENRDYFEKRKNGKDGYGSAHYIIDQNGLIIAAVPEYEIAYHCGSAQPDPESGKIYTDEARKRYGKYASEKSSPNNCTIAIELCPTEDNGVFSTATIDSAVELCADICRRYRLTEQDITTHKNVVGWKDCPVLWAKNPVLLDAFRFDVSNVL